MVDCSVRLLTEGDLPMLLDWRNAPETRQFMFTQHLIAPKEHELWFANASKDPARRLLIVEDLDAPIGFVQFNPVKPGATSWWGFYARPKSKKGTGTKIGRAALRYAFEVLNLHKVCGQAIESNLVSIAFHKKLGFTKESVLPGYQGTNTASFAVVCFGLDKNQWQMQSK